MITRRYFYRDGNSQYGPYTLTELADQPIRRDTLIWYEGSGDWVAAGTIPELSHLFRVEPVPPPASAQRKPGAPKLMILILCLLVAALIASLGYIGILLNQESRQKQTIEDLGQKLKLQMVVRQMDRDARADSAKTERRTMEMKKRAVRNNWEKKITAGAGNYKTGVFGGVKNLDVYLSNSTDYQLDEVTIVVSYIKEDGDIFASETVSLSNIAPNSQKTVRAPDTQRGRTVEITIKSIKSSFLNFCYPNKSADKEDPYFCD